MQFNKVLLPLALASSLLAAETTIYAALSLTTTQTDYDATSSVSAAAEDDDDVTTSYVDVTATSVASVNTDTTTTVGASTTTSTVPTSSSSSSSSSSSYYYSIADDTTTSESSSASSTISSTVEVSVVPTASAVSSVGLVSQIADGQIQAATVTNYDATVLETITSCSEGCTKSSSAAIEIESSTSVAATNYSSIESYAGVADKTVFSKLTITLSVAFSVYVALM